MYKRQPGRHVSQGTVLGHVGQTGRVTGPHLHWGLIINESRVNPLLLVDKQAIVPPPAAVKDAE